MGLSSPVSKIPLFFDPGYHWGQPEFGKPKRGQKTWEVCQNSQNLDKSIGLMIFYSDGIAEDRCWMASLLSGLPNSALKPALDTPSGARDLPHLNPGLRD